MAIDAHKNFSYSTVATAPSPADSGTSLVVAAGDGTKFPTVPFNCTVWPTGVDPSTTNAEIVRVTNISTDTFTITRTQESSSARSIVVGDQIAATISAKTLTDVEQANLLDGVKADTVAQTVTRGSLIYGNSTPKWDELVVGAANRVLWSNGTDISWSAAPRLANIADTGGTNRITLATSSPHVTITDDLALGGNLGLRGGGVNANRGLDYSADFSNSATFWGINFSSAVTFSASGQNLIGVRGATTHKGVSAGTHSAWGLDFQLIVDSGQLTAGQTVTYTALTGARVIPALTNFASSGTITLNVTTMKGVDVSPSITYLDLGGTAAGTIATYIGIHLQNPANTHITNAIGVDIAAITNATGYMLGIRNADRTAFTPSTVQTLAAGTTILANATYIMINSSGNVTLTNNPVIANGQDGQILIIQNVDSADTITIPENNVQFAPSGNLALGPGDNVTLIYSATLGDWYQIASANV